MKLSAEKLRELRPRSQSRNGGSEPSTGARVGARIGYRTRTLGLAALLALTAMVLVLSYVRSYKRGVEAGAATGVVLVAGRDLEPGTTGASLAGRGALVRKELPRRSIAPGSISTPRQVAGLVVAEPIYAGEQVTIRRFRPAAEQGVRGELSGTARAVVVPGDRHQLLEGLLRSGDRVDVLAAIKRRRPDGGEEAVTRVILRDLLVLRGGEDAAEVRGGGDALSVVLQLTDRQSQKLFYAMKNGEWALELRPYGRAAESPPFVDDAASVLGVEEGTP